MDAIVWKSFDLVTSQTFLYCRSKRGGLDVRLTFLEVTQRYLNYIA